MKNQYIVYIEQVNQTFVDVRAESKEEAREKALAIWRRDYACPRILSVEELEGGKNEN